MELRSPQHRAQRGEPDDRARRGAAGAAGLAHRLPRPEGQNHPIRRRQTRIEGKSFQKPRIKIDIVTNTEIQY